MTPKWAQRKNDERDITKPVPLPKRYDPIAPMHEEVFDKFQPMKKLKSKLTPPPRRQPFNKGTL